MHITVLIFAHNACGWPAGKTRLGYLGTKDNPSLKYRAEKRQNVRNCCCCQSHTMYQQSLQPSNLEIFAAISLFTPTMCTTKLMLFPQFIKCVQLRIMIGILLNPDESIFCVKNWYIFQNKKVLQP